MKHHAYNVLLINCQWVVTSLRATLLGLPNGILEIASLSPVNDTLWLSAHQIVEGRTPIQSATPAIRNFHLCTCQENVEFGPALTAR